MIGRAATVHGRRMREGVAPSRNGGSGGVTPEFFFEFHIAVDEFLCIFMDQKSDETSKGISQEAISICHFPTICSSYYIYILSLHGLSYVRGL